MYIDGFDYKPVSFPKTSKINNITGSNETASDFNTYAFENYGNGYYITATGDATSVDSSFPLKCIYNELFNIKEEETLFGEARQASWYLLEIASKLKSKIVYVITPSETEYHLNDTVKDNALPQHIVFLPDEQDMPFKETPVVAIKPTLINYLNSNDTFQLISVVVDPTNTIRCVDAGGKFLYYNDVLFNIVKTLAKKAALLNPSIVEENVTLDHVGLLNFNKIYEIDQSSYTLDVLNASLQRAKELKQYSFVVVRLQDPNEFDLSKQRQFVYITEREKLIRLIGKENTYSIVYKTIDGDEFAGYGYLARYEEDVKRFFKELIYGNGY